MTDNETAETAALRRRVAEIFPALLDDLEDLVRIPGISGAASDPASAQHSARAVADLLREAGMTSVEILRAQLPDGTPGAPAVVAHRDGPAGAPTVLLYAHHDVQPTGPLDEWATKPFEPVRRGERLYGRGAADDKAGIVAHLGAIRALTADGDLPVSLTLFVEGEEEAGSPTFADFLHRYRERLAADVIVVADSGNWRVGVPALTTSLRGLVDCVVEVAALEHAVHSGFYGGPILDAITLLARLIATLHDDDGSVAIEGLHAEPDPAVDYAEEDFRADASVLPGARLAGTGSISGRMWSKPAISVLALDAPAIAEASNTIAPTATAKLSLRIAPGQDPADALSALRRHLEEHAPFGARVTVRDGETGRPYRSPQDTAGMRAARSAFAQAWGRDPVDTGVGGSIPFIADLVEVFPNADILITGVEDPDSRAHAANESVHLGDLERAVLAEALLLRAVADQAR